MSGAVTADPRLATERLALRPLEPGDVPDLHAHWTDPEVRRFLWDGASIPREQVEEVVEGSRALFGERGFGLWSLRLRDSGELAGCGGYWYFREPPELELVLSLSPGWWGLGLATEAGRALVEYAFATLGFGEVQGSADAANAASVRLMERLGMRLRRRGVMHGLDTVVYAVARAEWEAEGDRPGTPGSDA